MQLEDLGFCEKGEGGRFVADGNLISGVGKLPFNTDGGGLCNNHPANRGGMTKVIEAVRQLRGEAHPKVQVKNCDLALAHGTGGSLGTRHGSATADPGDGSSHGRERAARSRPRRRRPRPQPFWDAGGAGQAPGRSTAPPAASAHYYPRADLPVLLQRPTPSGRTPPARGTIYTYSVMRRATRALRHRLRDARRGRRP